MRLFLALPFEGETLERLTSAVEAARASLEGQGWRILAPSQWHLTLIFYGEVNEERASELVQRVEQVPVRKLVLEPIRWGSPGSGNRRVKTFGFLVGPSIELTEFRMDVWNFVGGTSDRKKFRPHITVARRRDMAPRPELASGEARYGLGCPPAGSRGYFEGLVPESLIPNKLVLFQSELLPSGAVHTPLVVREL